MYTTYMRSHYIVHLYVTVHRKTWSWGYVGQNELCTVFDREFHSKHFGESPVVIATSVFKLLLN